MAYFGKNPYFPRRNEYFSKICLVNINGRVQLKKGFLGQLRISTLEFFPGFGIKLDSPMPCHWKNSKDFQQHPVFGKILPFRGYE